MEIYAEVWHAVVDRYMEQICTPKGWYLVRNFVTYKSLYNQLVKEGQIEVLGNGNYRLNF